MDGHQGAPDPESQSVEADSDGDEMDVDIKPFKPAKGMFVFKSSQSFNLCLYSSKVANLPFGMQSAGMIGKPVLETHTSPSYIDNFSWKNVDRAGIVGVKPIDMNAL